MKDRSNVFVVLKGLEVLTTLNQRNGLSIAELSRILKIPRSTTYRLILTLVKDGFVQRDSGRRYRLTTKIRLLCDAIQPEPWIETALPNVVQDLHERFRWPVAVASLRGDRILLDYVTDRQCPQLITRRMVGYEISFLDMAAGRVILAELPAAQQRRLLEKLIQIEADIFKSEFGSLTALRARLAIVRRRGYDENRSKGFRVLAVPLHVPQVHAVLSIRVPDISDAQDLDPTSILNALHNAARAITRSSGRAQAIRRS